MLPSVFFFIMYLFFSTPFSSLSPFFSRSFYFLPPFSHTHSVVSLFFPTSHTHSVVSTFFSHMFSSLLFFLTHVWLSPSFPHTCLVVSTFFPHTFSYLLFFLTHVQFPPLFFHTHSFSFSIQQSLFLFFLH